MLLPAFLLAVSFASTAVVGNTVTVPIRHSVEATEESGFIQSPGYPNKYPNNVDGEVHFDIDGSEGKFLEITAVTFNVEGDDEKCPDRLTFAVSVGDEVVHYGPRCGPSPLWFNKMLINTTDVSLRFTSNSFGVRPGFKLSYRVVDHPVPSRVSNFTCGRPKIKPCLPTPADNPACNSRIVNGADALPHSWPWQIGIVGADKPNNVYCGGSLVHPCWVVTAAHCIRGEQTAKVKVRVGSHRQSEQREVLPVSEIVMHPGYNFITLNYDIALLKLGKCVAFNDTVRAVCVSNRSDPFIVGKLSAATGWGTTEQGGEESPDELQEVALKIDGKAKCQRANRGTKITDQMICASAPGKDTCQGDSGGPLVYMNPDKSYRLVGVTSFGNGCAQPGSAGVYANVRHFYDWISLFVSNI